MPIYGLVIMFFRLSTDPIYRYFLNRVVNMLTLYIQLIFVFFQYQTFFFSILRLIFLCDSVLL